MARLVGREQEMERLRLFLARCASGPSALVVEGEAGIGKSALFDAAVAGAGQLRVLLVRCVQAETAMAYAGLADLLDGCTRAVLPALTPPQRRALEIALLHAEAGTEAVEPHVVGRATLQALRHLAAECPTLLAIDDVQWLDTASARVLSFALRRLDTAGVSVLATRRPGGEESPLAFEDVVPLGPLDAADVAALLVARFGPRLPQRLMTRVLDAAAGNPLYAIELAAQTLSGRPSDQALRLPPRLESLLSDRVARLPDEAARPLAAVASLVAPTVALVCAAVGAGARTGLDSALDAEVLMIEEGRLRFSHPLLGVAALAHVPLSARRALHDRLAAVVTDPEQRARHLVSAANGPDAALAAAVEQGADHARARGAPEAAAELAEAAARLTPQDRVEDVRRRLVAAGYHWVTAGESGRGRSHFVAALDGMPAGPARAELRWRLGMVCHLDGDTREAVRQLETAMVEARGTPAVEATVASKLAGVYGWQGRMAEARRLGDEAMRQAEVSGDPRALLECLALSLFGMLMQGSDIPDELVESFERQAGAAGPFAAHEDPESVLAIVAFVRGDLAGAVAGMENVMRRAEEQGDELGFVWLAGYLAHVEIAAGRWVRARYLADEAVRRARSMRIALALTPALQAMALVHAHVGALDTARSAAAEVLEHAEPQGLVAAAGEAHAALGFAALSCGDAATAHTELRWVREHLDQRACEPALMWLPWSDMDALVELGELEQAEALAAELHRRGRELDRPFALATAARGRGLVRAARGDLAGARAELDQALVEHDRVGWPFERARTLLALGSVLRRGKQKRAARDRLQQALAIFDQLGAPLWSAKATAELARIGGRPPTTGALTATERRVAALAAEGRTNREIADQLFLSPKTVAAHLTSVYAKLAVRSRTELSRRFPDGGG